MDERQQLLRTKDGTPRALDWSIHISGGISRIDTSHVTEGCYSEGFPTLTIHVDEKTDLEQVRLPENVLVYQIQDLRMVAFEKAEQLQKSPATRKQGKSLISQIERDQSLTGMTEEAYRAQVERIGVFVQKHSNAAR